MYVYNILIKYTTILSYKYSIIYDPRYVLHNILL